MADYRVRIRLLGPLGTPLHSGTLFGHLCWAMYHRRGEQRLVAWLKELEANPLLLSSGMPAGYLPRPLLKPWRGTGSGGNAAQDAEEAKRIKKAEWLTVEEFLALRDSMTDEGVQSALRRRRNGGPARALQHRVAHNTIDRRTGTTPETGGLYFVDEAWPASGKSDEWDIYARSAMTRDEVEELFAFAGEHGYGRDGSLGRGRWHCTVETADKRLFEGGRRRWMSLSHGSLSANMLRARYKLQTHYGRVGPALATKAQAFKRPLVLLKPGATFAGDGDGPFGALLKGVHPHREEIVHNAWHLAVGFDSPEEE